MTTARKQVPHRILSAALALAGLVAGCSGDGGALRGAAELGGFATQTQAPKPFVVEARPAETDFVPVGTTVSRRAERKTVPEFKTLEAELEAKRLSNESAAATAQRLGKTPPPKPAKVD